jgi:hypothetical protein
MPTAKKSSKQLTSIALKAVKTRRDKNPGGSTERLTANDVQAAFKRRKSFSTGDVMREFSAAKDNATACAAILRGRKLIEKIGEAADGTSVWRWVA